MLVALLEKILILVTSLCCKACKIVWRTQSPKAPDEKKKAIVNFFGYAVVVSGCACACFADDDAANADTGDTVAILINCLALLMSSG